MFFLTIVLLTTDLFSSLWPKEKKKKPFFLGVELHVEASSIIQEMSPIQKRISTHRIFCSLYFLVRGCKQKQASNRPWPSAETADKNSTARAGEVEQLIARLKTDCGWNKEGRRKFALRNCWGRCGMTDQVSDKVSEAQEGDMERRGSEFIFNCICFLFLSPSLLEQRKGGDANGRKLIFGQNLYTFGVWLFSCLSFSGEKN